MKTDILDEMKRLERKMNELMANFWESERPLLTESGDESKEIQKYRKPLTDIWETDDNVIAKLELPGIEKEDIDINVTEDSLEVKVEKEKEEKEEKPGFYRKERSYKGFYRCFSLPQNLESERAEAIYKNGVLEIKIPKSGDEKQKTKKIEIK